MRHLIDSIRLAAIGITAAFAIMGHAHALLIVPTFDLNPAGSDPNSLNNTSNPAGEVAAIETAISTIDGLYSNPGTVQVLFNYNSGLSGAQSEDGQTFVPYSQYASQLGTDSAANPSNTILATAVANLFKDNTANYVIGTTAFLRVGLGFTGAGTTPCFNSSGTYVSGCDAFYDGIVSISNLSTASNGAGKNAQAVSEVEHELDEVLGGGGTGTTIGENLSPDLCPGLVTCSLTAIGPTDLYRYRSASSTCAGALSTTNSLSTSASEVACYSIDGGQTAFVQFNQAGGGSDYGDFATTSPNIPSIQDAYYPGATNDYSGLSPEFEELESIGYDAVPEPSTIALFIGALGALGWLRRSRSPAVDARWSPGAK